MTLWKQNTSFDISRAGAITNSTKGVKRSKGDEHFLMLFNSVSGMPTFYSKRWHSTSTPNSAFATPDVFGSFFARDWDTNDLINTCIEYTSPLPTSLCVCGLGEQTAEHVLKDCPEYRKLRIKYWSTEVT